MKKPTKCKSCSSPNIEQSKYNKHAFKCLDCRYVFSDLNLWKNNKGFVPILLAVVLLGFDALVAGLIVSGAKKQHSKLERVAMCTQQSNAN